MPVRRNRRNTYKARRNRKSRMNRKSRRRLTRNRRNLRQRGGAVEMKVEMDEPKRFNRFFGQIPEGSVVTYRSLDDDESAPVQMGYDQMIDRIANSERA